MKKSFSILLLIFCAMVFMHGSSFSQVAGYPFFASQQTYTEINGGIQLVVGTYDDNVFTAQPIGFTFNFNGTNYTTFSLNANGFIVFGNTVTSSYCNLSAGINPNSVMAYNTDIRNNTIGSSDIRYQTLGTAPNRYTVIQWKNAMMFAGSTSDIFNFQIILYETPNTVEVRYGQFTMTTTQTGLLCAGSTPTDAPFAGLMGATNADFNSRTITNGSTTWATSTAAALNTERCQTSPTNIPVMGQSYAWRFAVPSVVNNNTPLSGTYTIGPAGNYTTFFSAISDLNARGISGPVTFNVAAGNTFDENALPPIFTTGTASNPIVFQKSGAGANPLVRGMNGFSSVAASTDAVIQIVGADYITFNGIDVADHPSNATTATQMEYGYLIRNLSALDGAKNNTIKNCSIDLRNNVLLNVNTIGIGQSATTTFGSGLTPTAQIGCNDNNKYYNITVVNSYIGVRLRNGSGTVVDDGNEVGTEAGGVTDIGGPNPNSIGNSTTATSGIQAELQSNLKIFNCRVRNVTHTSTGAVHGIYLLNTSLPVAGLGNCQIYNNEVSDINKTTSTTASTSVYGIRVDAVGTSATTIYNNIVYGLTYLDLAAASATIGAIGIQCTGTVSTGNAVFNVYYNSVLMNITGANVTNTCLRMSSGGVLNARNNALSNQSPSRLGVARNHSIRREAGTIDPNSKCNVLNVLNDVGVTGFTGFYTGATTTDRNGLINWQTAPYTTTAATFDTYDMGSTVNNPNFTSLTNLVPVAGSSAINSGDPIAGITTDRLGNTRNATTPDIGAYEDGVLAVTDSHGPRLTYTPAPSFNSFVLTVTDNVNGAVANARFMYRVAGSVTAFTELAPDLVPGARNGNYTWNSSISSIPAGNYEYYVAVRDGATNNTTLTPMALNTAAPVFTTDPTPANYTVNPLTGTTFRTFTRSSTLAGGTYHVGDAQVSLKKLTNVAALLNSSTITGNITFLLDADYDGTTGETFPIVFNEISQSGGSFTVTIRPDAGVTTRTTAGDPGSGLTQSLINLNGADNITFDGRAGGVGTSIAWIFRNTRTTATVGPTFILQNDASSNILTYLQIEGQSAATTTGSIYFGSTTTNALTGNDNNTVSFCSIRDRSDVAGAPAIGIFSLGNVTNVNAFNSGNNILNNNIFNIFNGTLSFSGSIRCETGNANWTISNNSFYQDAPRTVTVSATTFFSIFNNISNTNFGFTVSGNFIGGSAPLCAGSPSSYSSASAIAFSLTPINIFMNDVVNASSIQGNTIKNISMVNGTTTGAQLFRPITCGSTGIVNVGNVTGNIIGSTVDTGSIYISTPFATTGGVTAIGIQHSGIGSINNNTIGSITHNGITATGASGVQGINWASSPVIAFNYNCSNNTIGSLTVPDNIKDIGGARVSTMRGIVTTINYPGTLVQNNNTVANISCYSNSSTNAATVYGIQNGGSGNTTITGNTVRNLSDATGVATSIMVAGIVFSGTSAIANVPQPLLNLSQNTVSGLRTTNTGAFNSPTYSITYLPVVGNSSSVISQNKVYDITTNLTGSPTLIGIDPRASCNVVNNMVALTNGDATAMSNNKNYGANDDVKMRNNMSEVTNNMSLWASINNNRKSDVNEQSIIEIASNENAPAFDIKVTNSNTAKGKETTGLNSAVNGATMFGMAHFGTGAVNYYYNTIYVGGTAPAGSILQSAAFLRQIGGPVTMRNNLLINARTGGTGNHLVIANQIVNPPSAGWNSSASNYNVLIGSGPTIAEWGSGNLQDINQWRTSTGGDLNTWSTTSADIVPASLFTDISTGNLNINSGNAAAWVVSGKGIAISGIGTDYSGNSRSTSITSGCTDIGANEFAATPPGNPVATQTGTPGSGSTTTYSLYGRELCSITWGTGGTYPTSVNVNYFSGVSPLAPNVTNPQRVSNSYWTAVPVGTFSGTTYDITYKYGDNETFSITSPSTNVLLAKNDNTFWMSYPRGTGSLQSDQSGTSVTARGMLRFSSFTLTDAALPSERPLTPANNSTGQPTSVTLVWNKSALASTYRVQVATDSLFNTVVFNDSTVTDTTKLVTGLVAGSTNYWWRVNGKSGVGTGAWCQVYKFTTTAVLPPAVVNLSVIPGGFYNTGTGRLNMKDTIRVYLVDSVTCLKVDSTRGVVDSVNFQASISFNNAATGNYYMLIYHRNHLAVATRFKTSVTRGSTVNYDFTNDSAKAFGFNMVKVSASPVRWGMIPGDANRDGFTDGLDQTIWIGQNGLDGYLPSDFNGDLFVDGLDQTIWILYNGNSSFLPCGFFFNVASDVLQPNTASDDAKKINMMILERKRLNEANMRQNQK